MIPVALGGCWSFRGRISKTVTPDGERVDEKGPLPDLQIARNRRAYILYDSNCLTNQKVYAARQNLIGELQKLGCSDVRIINLLASPDVNGPDDHFAKFGDLAIFDLFELARRAAPQGDVPRVEVWDSATLS